MVQQSEERRVTLTIDSRQISREAVLKSAYWFSKSLYIELPPASTETDSFQVVLTQKPPTIEAPAVRPLEELIAEFQNSLIDSELRVRVQNETSAIRELILAKAFAEAGVLEDQPLGSFDDPVFSSQHNKNSNLSDVTKKEHR